VKHALLVLAGVALGAAVVLCSARPSTAQGFNDPKRLVWERLEVDLEQPPRFPPMIESQRQLLLERMALYRARVPGGWLVMTRGGLTHLPDPSHEWNGASLPR
jgi:hypothetical protein